MAKKYISIIITGFLSILLLFSCSTEEDLNQTPTNLEVEKVKKWFENNSNTLNLKIIQYTKEIEWDKAIITDGEKGQIIEVPITLQDFIATTSSTDKKLNNYHRLLFTKNENETYNCFDLQIITSETDFDNLDQNFNYYNIKDNFNGYVTLYDPIEQKADYQKFKNGSIWKPRITGKSDADAELTCTYLVWIYEDGHVEIITRLYCEAGGVTGGGAEGGTGGYGGAAENMPPQEIETPPSCESFNFVSKPGTLWQEAAVANIHFNIVVLTPEGYYFSQIIQLPTPTLFGTPTNISIGGTDISAGLAATLSAKALDVSMKETVQMYGNKPVSELTVRYYFMERLKYNYSLFIPGGRVNFNADNFSVVPTNYQTNLLSIGNCG